MFEWRFDDSYSDLVKDSLADDLEAPVMKWTREMIPTLINELATKPDRKTALTAQGSNTSVKVNSGKVCLFIMLSIVRADGFAQCRVYVGPEHYIQNKAKQFRAEWTRQLSKPGTEATVVEWYK